MSRLARVRRLTREEVAWRLRTAGRAAVQRVDVGLRTPRWNRRDLQTVLAEGIVTAPARHASQREDWQAAQDALVEALHARQSRFLLNPRSAAALRTDVLARWPSAATQASERADRILAGLYDVLGYRGLEFAPAGGDVDWHLDPVHKRRAPLRFWASVPYLDPAIGDHKIIWELNRHQHWLQLGRAAWLTGDRRYAGEIVRQLQAWLDANPPLLGINWASMLEIGFRAMSWTWALHFLIAGADDSLTAGAKAPALQASDESRSAAASAAASPWLVDLLIGLDRQMKHIEQNLSYYFSPNTHLTGEALALFVVGHALPELEGSERWVTVGRRILLSEIDRQIQPDGGHAERSTHYQRYTLDFYLHALLIAQRVRDRDAIPALTDAVTRLACFTRTIADDRGTLPLIGDDDGGMLWPIAGRPCSDVRDSLALAAVVLDRPDLAPWGVPEEVFWLGGSLALQHARSIEARLDTTTHPSRTLPESGYVVLRDGLGSHAVLDAGPHGYLNAGHAHADALAITLTSGSKPLLVDPGTSTYTMDPRIRDQMRAAASHNTVTIDNRPQSIPAGPFHWRTRADGWLHASRHNGAFDWAEASHDGYEPVLHRRMLFRTESSGWLVADDIVGEGTHSASTCWQFDPAWIVTADAPGRLRATHRDGETVWLLYDAGDIRLTRGDEASGSGWVAPVYGTRVPAWSARVTRNAAAPFAMVMWIDRASAAAAPPPMLERMAVACEAGSHAIGARVVRGSRVSTFLLRPYGADAPDTDGCGLADYQTNARAMHYTENAGTLMTLDLVDASRAIAVREGWISIATSEPIRDLHLAFAGDALQVRTSHPGPRLRIKGGDLRSLRTVHINDREVPLATRLSDTVVIDAADWTNPAPAPLLIQT